MSSSSTRAELIGQLMERMREVSGLSVLYSDAMARRMGINATDLECFDMVLRAGEISPTTLAQQVGVTTGAITGVLDRLERAGLVVRHAAADDRRRLVIRPAPEAAGRALALGKPMADAVSAKLGRYDRRELQLLLEMIGDATDAAREAIMALEASP